jgi:threonine dehydratase
MTPRGEIGSPGPDLQPTIAALVASAVAARMRIAAHLGPTPVEEVGLRLTDGRRIQVKAEHRQHTGSFKVRGALAKLTALDAGGGDARHAGIVTASSGNHGLGVAHALAVLGGDGVVVVPVTASPAKVARLELLGVPVRRVGSNSLAAEVAARREAVRTGRVYVSPYNDLEVIAGQATIGLELIEQVTQRPDAVVVAVGGGGLVSGIAAVLRQAWPGTRIVGASPSADAAMAESVRSGRVVDVDARPTLSDGTAGGLEPGTITLSLCSALVDEWELVDEESVADAMRQAARDYDVVEGAAAVALAAAGRRLRCQPSARVLAVSCGGNVAPDLLARVLAGGSAGRV